MASEEIKALVVCTGNSCRLISHLGPGRYRDGLLHCYRSISLAGIADRPLTYRPYPRGAGGRPDRYHQRVKHAVPEGVRVASLKGGQKAYEARFIGGSLITLLYLVQHDVNSMDAWTARIQTPDTPDLAVLDLDRCPA